MSIENWDSLRQKFVNHKFFEKETIINSQEFASIWHYRQTLMMTQLLQAFTLCAWEQSKALKARLKGDLKEGVEWCAQELFETFASIIREETWWESIVWESPSKMAHTELLEHMYQTMWINTKEIQKTYNPLNYEATNKWIDYIYQNQYHLIHHIAWMEVFENIAKPLFDKMYDIFSEYEGDRRFLTFHQAIEWSHGEKNDDMTDLYLKIYPESKEELSILIDIYSQLWSAVLDEFASMKWK